MDHDRTVPTPPPLPQPAATPERLYWRVIASLAVGVLVVWIAAPPAQLPEPAPVAPATAPQPYVSPHPAPQVDASMPTPEPAPTF